MALVRGLPLDGAFARAEGAWSDQTELLAVIVEQLDALTRLQYSAHSGRRPNWQSTTVPRPKPVDDPVPRPRREPTPDEVLQLFGKGRG